MQTYACLLYTSGIAVEHRIEEAAKARDPIGFARHAPVHHIEQAGPDYDYAAPAETARREQERRPDIYHEAQKSQKIGRKAEQCQAPDNRLDDLAEENTDRGRYCHEKLLREFVYRLQLEDFQFLCAAGRLQINGVAHLFAEQRSSDRRTGGYPAGGRVGLFAGHKLSLIHI